MFYLIVCHFNFVSRVKQKKPIRLLIYLMNAFKLLMIKNQNRCLILLKSQLCLKNLIYWLINSKIQISRISQNFDAVVSNVNLGSTQVYSKVSSNIAVLSYMINNTIAFSTGFTQSDSQDIELVSNKSQVDFGLVKSSAFLDPKVLKKITNNSGYL